jgi:hypothetical protein
VFIIEGVTMYVTAESLRATLEVLTARFPGHEVYADLMTRGFLERYRRTIKRIIADLGAQMIPGDQPARPFEAAGYRQLSSAQIAALAFTYRSLGALTPVLRLLMPELFAGYTVRVFQAPLREARASGDLGEPAH